MREKRIWTPVRVTPTILLDSRRIEIRFMELLSNLSLSSFLSRFYLFGIDQIVISSRWCASRDARFDQSECVICSDFHAWEEPFSEVYMIKFRFIPSLCVIWALYLRGKLLEHLILIVITLILNILLSWAFVTSLNCSVIGRPPWWYECYFRRSSWIHCWLLLAVLSDYFGHLVTSTFLLCKCRGLPGPMLVFPSWDVVEWRDRLSQVA